VPTLVLHPQESPLSSSEGGRKLAALIPNARLVMISGDHPLGDAAEGLAAIDQFLAEMAPDPQQETGLPSNGLSPREIDVLRLLAAGRSNQQIADELVISLNTARRHVSNIYDKTGVANRTEASVYARDHGIA
jgi:DNA-binding NarL/FixJ family response regulator